MVVLVSLLAIVLLICGGAVALLASSMGALSRALDIERGPREHTDEGFRVRVRAPGPEWEILSGELAASWSGEALVLLRSVDCTAGVQVRPVHSETTHEEAVRDVFGTEVRATPGAAVRGLTEPTYELVDTEGVFATSFVHDGVFYWLEARDEVCRRALSDALEIIPGRVTPHWLRAPVEDAIGRSYRVRGRVFESAATGLVVDANEPFSAVIEGASRLEGGAEIVLRHRDGVRISFDPMRRTPRQIEAHAAEEGDGIEEMPWLGETRRFVRRGGARVELSTFVELDGLSVRVKASGATTAAVRAALADVGPRVRRLDAEALEALRAELMPQIHERRSGEGWSLRDGTFRTHADTGPTLAIYVPRWSDVLAGRDARHTREAGEVVTIRRRELGVTATATIAPTAATDASEALAAYLAASGLTDAPRIGPVEVDRVGRARAELAIDDAREGPGRMTVLVQLVEGTAFALGVSWRTPEHDDVARWVDEVVEGFVAEPRVVPPFEVGVHRDERLGVALYARGAVFSIETPELVVTESAASVCARGGTASICVHAAADLSGADALLAAVDRIDARRSASAIWSIPPRPTQLDDRPASERVFTDGGEEVHVVSALVDRTVYVAVARNPPSGDWAAAFQHIDLDP